ncbi:hypothetical protein NL676_026441 [Syzygium grande]|nr:hypothetical protein NL676_026441 [Syzygium grande]
MIFRRPGFQCDYVMLALLLAQLDDGLLYSRAVFPTRWRDLDPTEAGNRTPEPAHTGGCSYPASIRSDLGD